MTAHDAATPPSGLRALLRWRPTPNPVLRRELMERWRGRRGFVVATVYLAVLTGLLLLLLWAASSWLAGGFVDELDPGPTLGRFLLESVFGLVLLLVLFVGPGYAAAQISQERERRTLGLLQITLVSPWRIVTGKLGAASAWLLLLVAMAAPMAAAAFFLGGVTVGDLLRGVAYLAVVTVAVAAMGIGISSLVRRTVAAVVLTYGLVLLLVGGTLFAGGLEAVFDRGRSDEPPVSFRANPFVGLADAVRANGEFVDLPSLLSPFALALPRQNRAGDFGPMGVGPGDVAVMEDGAVFQGQVPAELPAQRLDQPALDQPALDQPALDRGPERQPVWLGVMALYAGAGMVALLVAARRVRPGHEPRSTRQRGSGRAPREVVASAPPPPPPPPPPPTTEPS